MFNFIKNYKKNVTKNTLMMFMLLIFLTSIVLVVGATYAADTSSYTIVFNRAEGTEVMRTCHTDENGKLDSDCINTIGDVCARWSLDKYYGTPQSNQIAVSEFAGMTFTENKDYYCVGGTSGHYNMGCYVCKTDSNIMHWAANGDANEKCSAGYTKSTTIISEDKCVTIIPDSCYVCKSDNNIMKWDNNGDSDGDCSSGYIPDPEAKDISQCKTIIPDACYVCKNNNNVMKWDNNGSMDNNCSSGYTKTNTPEIDCAPIKNPPTSDIMIFGVWIVGLGAICYSIYYL